MSEYKAPDFILNADVNTVYNEMRAQAKGKINTGEGSFFYDHTYPVALQKSEMAQQKINGTLQLMFPQFAWGYWLDLHGEIAGIARKAATKATGSVLFTGDEGTVIPIGTLVKTPSISGQPGTEYETTAQTIINAGDASAPIRALEAGPGGNAAQDTITVMGNYIPGVTSVSNYIPAAGGYAAEEDEPFRARIMSANQSAYLAGSKESYEAWAMEVEGVGAAFCTPEWNGPSTVKVTIVDANGGPASPELIATVNDRLKAEDGSGVAPIGADITTETTEMFMIAIEIVVEYEGSPTVEQIATMTAAAKKNIDEYYKQVGKGGMVRMSHISAATVPVPGIADVTSVTLNGLYQNIQLAANEYPQTAEVSLIDY